MRDLTLAELADRHDGARGRAAILVALYWELGGRVHLDARADDHSPVSVTGPGRAQGRGDGVAPSRPHRGHRPSDRRPPGRPRAGYGPGRLPGAAGAGPGSRAPGRPPARPRRHLGPGVGPGGPGSSPGRLLHLAAGDRRQSRDPQADRRGRLPGRSDHRYARDRSSSRTGCDASGPRRSRSTSVQGSSDGCRSTTSILPGTGSTPTRPRPRSSTRVRPDLGPDARTSPDAVGAWIVPRVPPGVPPIPLGFYLRVTGHFDDASAAGCRRAVAFGVPGRGVPLEAQADSVQWCREQFVVSAWQTLLGPEGRPFDPRDPQLHRREFRCCPAGPSPAAGSACRPLTIRIDPAADRPGLDRASWRAAQHPGVRSGVPGPVRPTPGPVDDRRVPGRPRDPRSGQRQARPGTLPDGRGRLVRRPAP